MARVLGGRPHVGMGKSGAGASEYRDSEAELRSARTAEGGRPHVGMGKSGARASEYRVLEAELRSARTAEGGRPHVGMGKAGRGRANIVIRKRSCAPPDGRGRPSPRGHG